MILLNLLVKLHFWKTQEMLIKTKATENKAPTKRTAFAMLHIISKVFTSAKQYYIAQQSPLCNFTEE